MYICVFIGLSSLFFFFFTMSLPTSVLFFFCHTSCFTPLPLPLFAWHVYIAANASSISNFFFVSLFFFCLVTLTSLFQRFQTPALLYSPFTSSSSLFFFLLFSFSVLSLLACVISCTDVVSFFCRPAFVHSLLHKGSPFHCVLRLSSQVFIIFYFLLCGF